MWTALCTHVWHLLTSIPQYNGFKPFKLSTKYMEPRKTPSLHLYWSFWWGKSKCIPPTLGRLCSEWRKTNVSAKGNQGTRNRGSRGIPVLQFELNINIRDIFWKMTLFTMALIVETMSLLTLQMWRIVSSLCSLELKELMKNVSNDFLYIYLPICASFEFSLFTKLHLLLTYYNKVYKKFYVLRVSQSEA